MPNQWIHEPEFNRWYIKWEAADWLRGGIVSAAAAGIEAARVHLSARDPTVSAFIGFGAAILLVIVASIIFMLRRKPRAIPVESPLIRRDNGALDWKPIQFEQIANKAFVNAEVALDGKRYIDCSFERCTFVYEGSAPGEVIGDNSKLIRTDPNAVNFALRSSNPIVIAAWQLQYKIEQGGIGIKGMRFEPKN